MTHKNKKESPAPAKAENTHYELDLFPAGLAVFEYGSVLELKYYNEELPKIFGFSSEEFRLKAESGSIFGLGMKNSAAKKLLEQAALTGEKLESTFVAEKSDASAMWLFTSSYVKKAGKKLVCSTLMYDISLQKSIIRKYGAECEKNRLLRSRFSALTFEYDPISDFFTINSEDKNIPSQKFASFVGRFPQTELIHKEDRAQFYWWLSLKEKEPESSLDFRADFDGLGYKHYHGTMAVICDKYGTPYHCTGVFEQADSHDKA